MLVLILVVTKDDHQKLNENIYRLRMTPLMHDNMQRALNNVKHTDLSAVVIDGQFKEVDILELILNIRDIRPDLPVIIVGTPTHDPVRPFILEISGTHLVASCDKHFDNILKTITN